MESNSNTNMADPSAQAQPASERAFGDRAHPPSGPTKPRRTTWGIWEFKRSSFVLRTKIGSPHVIEFDLGPCRDSAVILDQVFQIATLERLADKDVRDLLRAINAILRPPGNYCSGGQHKLADPRKVAKQRGYL